MESEKTYAFGALLSRMKYITRWGLMRSARSESVSEHTAEVAVIAHMLALTARDILGQTAVRPDTVAVAALYHDAGEILTGDMPTPVKYKNEALKNAYKQLEREAANTLADMLPDELRVSLRPLLTGDELNDEETCILKASDVLGALVKCIEEEGSGNSEFRSAKRQQMEKLDELSCPAADYFVAHFLPCYAEDLDGLAHSY